MVSQSQNRHTHKHTHARARTHTYINTRTLIVNDNESHYQRFVFETPSTEWSFPQAHRVYSILYFYNLHTLVIT